MALDVPNPDQIVVVGRASSRDVLASEWAYELRNSARLSPEDLTVQVKLTPKGCWHRKAIGGQRTACGKPLGGYASRDESYAGELCEDGCFSEFELIELARITDPEVPADEDR